MLLKGWCNKNMKYCSHCGAPMDDGDLFCPKCGAKVKEETSSSVKETDISSDVKALPVPKATTPEGKIRQYSWWIIIGSCFLMAIIICQPYINAGTSNDIIIFGVTFMSLFFIIFGIVMVLVNWLAPKFYKEDAPLMSANKEYGVHTFEEANRLSKGQRIKLSYHLFRKRGSTLALTIIAGAFLVISPIISSIISFLL